MVSKLSPMPKGGKRPGAGRPPLDPSGERRRSVKFTVTTSEEAILRKTLQDLRKQQPKKSDD